ncbi:SDR family NAD(P)-dependent oxidoreductase [Streptomyces sp. NBC_00582]|uniref:SDR family NAD(P)-dependent oxidoreductase n=1 Tax=Streptomyces sp. NBC_00582 TaxID=2975783 RepID=UPI002E801D01|nr:SDR family NAD(P)-dependent oxidoreductase [Streptomyces sp. NBC_00582]WUB67482.1 SDR family NAD(P)-dependent oxidoreductase [Streptomyces sp. NBC_00582]
MNIKDTAALVTGGASGLGGATARELAGRGARVFALDLAEGIDKASVVGGVTYVEADVTDTGQVRAAVDRAANCGMPLRTVVNCAGVAASAPILSNQGWHDLALFRRVVEINLIGTFTVMVLAAEAMAKTEPLADDARGVVINTASIGAFDGLAGTAAYAASKSGVAGLTLPAARDLAAQGIRVMTVAPGMFNTHMLGLVEAGEDVRAAAGANVPLPKRLGHSDEFARLVVEIVENDYLNGEVIRLDGALRLGAS